MKMLLTFSLLLASTFSFSQNIQHGDILKKNSLTLNVDGIELWDIPVNERETAIKDFTEKCTNEIPQRTQDHAELLEASHSFFAYNALDIDHQVITMEHRGFGTQLICRASIKTNSEALFHFAFEYSEIFSNRNGTEEICRERIQDIDATSVQEAVLTRRAYFTYGYDRAGNVIFPKCQTLKIFVKANGPK